MSTRIAKETDRVGLVVVRGAGKCFSAGHDLADIFNGQRPPRRTSRAETVERLADLPQPVISAGSWPLLYRRARTGAGGRPDRRGRIGKVRRYSRAMGAHPDVGDEPAPSPAGRDSYKAREMMLTCRTYSGAEAAAMGLANVCFPDDSFDKELRALADTILANSWFSHRANKRLLIETDGLPLGAGLSHEVYRSPGVGPDARERIAAFNSKTARRS